MKTKLDELFGSIVTVATCIASMSIVLSVVLAAL